MLSPVAGATDPASSFLRDLAIAAAGAVPDCADLSEETIWGTHGPLIWRAKGFRGSPDFYPVYHCGDLYSHSPLPLILNKRSLRLDQRTADRAARPGFLYASGRQTIDRDIVRLGGPPPTTFAIASTGEYAQRIAAAVQADVAAVEARHSGYTNVVLCGGKDSLNLLLLPWKNPVLVASAAPNYELVQAFVRENDLGMDVAKLEDRDDTLLPAEIAVNCCRNNLEHCRWSAELRRLSLELGRRVVFWKGQVGDVFMTPRWADLCHPPHALNDTIRAVCRPFGGRGEEQLRRLLQRVGFTQRLFFRSLWYRCAMWQGAHMSILRQLTEALVLSGYHGQAMRRVVSSVDLRRAVREDIRPLVGAILYGSPVRYPSTNPSPPVSAHRRGVSHPEPLLQQLVALGVSVQR